jgi:hypothetical protein
MRTFRLSIADARKIPRTTTQLRQASVVAFLALLLTAIVSSQNVAPWDFLGCSVCTLNILHPNRLNLINIPHGSRPKSSAIAQFGLELPRQASA